MVPHLKYIIFIIPVYLAYHYLIASKEQLYLFLCISYSIFKYDLIFSFFNIDYFHNQRLRDIF